MSKGTDWRPILNTNASEIAAGLGGHCYHKGGDRIWQLTADRQHWHPIAGPDARASGMAVDDAGNLYVAANHDGPRISKWNPVNGTWAPIAHGLPRDAEFVDIGVTSDGSVIWAAVRGSRLAAVDGLLRIQDGGHHRVSGDAPRRVTTSSDLPLFLDNEGQAFLRYPDGNTVRFGNPGDRRALADIGGNRLGDVWGISEDSRFYDPTLVVYRASGSAVWETVKHGGPFITAAQDGLCFIVQTGGLVYERV